MTITEFVLGMCEGKSGHYAMIRQALYAPTAPVCNRMQEPVTERSLSAIISRLQKQGLIQRNQSGVIKLLEKGQKRLRILRDKKNLPPHSRSRTKRQDKNALRMIVLYDIPEHQRRSRDWLRSELISLNFLLLQKSAWMGTGPLPKEFLKRLEELGILKHVHIFAIQTKGTLEG